MRRLQKSTTQDMYQNINKIYHAVIYVRLSKEDGDISSSAKLESNSISNQKALILDFLKDKKDIEVVSVRVDDGYSGSNFERPAFQAMLEDMVSMIMRSSWYMTISLQIYRN